MGVIYEAEHVDVKRPVAVKILRPIYATDLEIINSFRFEARATSALDSPYLVQIYDYFELPDGRSAMVMELLDGTDLARRSEPVMAPERTIGIMRQACKALQLVHDAGMVHRDLKPENIFVCSDGERPDAVRVLDFGIARLTTQATSAQLGGTPLYTAPEVILGGAQGPAADIYALGCVLYELLVGEPAFEREDMDATLQAHLSERPAPPSTRGDVPRELDAVVMRAIAIAPEDRFESMAEFEAALCVAQVETGIHTAWDDLPLPERIDPALRDRLLASMPDPAYLRRGISRLRLWTALALAVALGGTAVAAMTRPDPNAPEAMSPAQRRANELAQAARTAGSRAAWVYPPPDDVSSRTAFQVVLALEAMDEYGAPLAEQLRSDFATTLTRLGDDYWDAEGGARFAVAYYEQALLFEPNSVRARERSGVEQRALEGFSDRAARGGFALAELVSVEPLIELAMPNDAPPAERVARARTRRRGRAARAPKSDAPASPPELTPESEQDFAPDPAVEEPEGASDREAARALISNANAAARAGNDARAKILFERAAGENPRSAQAHAGLRDLAFDAGDYARAVRHGRRAAQLAPRSATHQLRLGDAYYRTHKYAQAEKAYAAAKRLGDARAKWRLQRAREKLGK